MATAEAKLDALAAQMNSMMKLMETFNRWRPDVDDFATALSKDPRNLTSRVEALQATPSSAPPEAPKREEEGPALLATTSQHHHRGPMSGPRSSIHP